jgi:hypothetical protein
MGNGATEAIRLVSEGIDGGMKVGDMARPKGAPIPFQRITNEEDGHFGIKYRMGGAIFGRTWEQTAWYSPDELEVQE